MRLEMRGFLLQLGVALTIELDYEHGGGITFDHRDLAGESGLRPRQVDEHAAHELDRGGIGLEDHGSRGHGGDQLVELKQDESGSDRSRYKTERGFEQRSQGAFGRYQQPGRIELDVGFEQLIERIAGGAPP